jgi:hypothetical protein
MSCRHDVGERSSPPDLTIRERPPRSGGAIRLVVAIAPRELRGRRSAICAESRPPTSRRNVCHTLKRMSCGTAVIRRLTGNPSGGPQGKPSGRWVTYVPYDPSFEMPDEGGFNGRLTGI